MTKLIALLLVISSCFTFSCIDSTANNENLPETIQENTANTANTPNKPNAPNAKPRIQVALILDTSSSMDGLIDQAKSQLWKMVNELATSKRDGEVPSIELALYEYGKDDIPADKGHLQTLVPLTNDLDLVSEKLFALTTNGGQEYCGWAIKDATEKLEWSEKEEDLKIIIIAGNEGFNQGPVDYKVACKEAITNGIVVNTIFCGDCNEGIRLLWQDGADRAEGKYLCINQNNKVAHIATPFDSDLGQLNSKLNDTYIAFGSQGAISQQRQVTQDANAAQYGSGNVASRAASKSKKSAYNNKAWDAVDAMEEDEAVVEEMEEEYLPAEMKGMNVEERKAYIKEKSEERAAVQKEIQEIAAKRDAFLAEKRREQAGDTSNTLDQVMLKTIREQAVKKGYKFEK
ncbi:MAG: VWA domain-containing protein [Aureispira sp.]